MLSSRPKTSASILWRKGVCFQRSGRIEPRQGCPLPGQLHLSRQHVGSKGPPAPSSVCSSRRSGLPSLLSPGGKGGWAPTGQGSRVRPRSKGLAGLGQCALAECPGKHTPRPEALALQSGSTGPGTQPSLGHLRGSVQTVLVRSGGPWPGTVVNKALWLLLCGGNTTLSAFVVCSRRDAKASESERLR